MTLPAIPGGRTGGVLAAVVLVTLGLLTGCAGQSSEHQVPGRTPATGRTAQTPAAEPQTAPPLATAPPGRIIQLPGGAPEGVAMDPSTGTLAVALRKPGRLALVDTATAAVRVVPAPGTPRHLFLAGPGDLLVPGEDTDTLAEVRLPAGTAGSETTVGRSPHDVAGQAASCSSPTSSATISAWSTMDEQSPGPVVSPSRAG
jgi:DNA-binding beta-propeller fold protein YncE